MDKLISVPPNRDHGFGCDVMLTGSVLSKKKSKRTSYILTGQMKSTNASCKFVCGHSLHWRTLPLIKLWQDLVVFIVVIVAVTVFCCCCDWKFRARLFCDSQLDELCFAYAAYTALWSGLGHVYHTEPPSSCVAVVCIVCGAHVSVLHNCLCCLFADNRLL